MVVALVVQAFESGPLDHLIIKGGDKPATHPDL